MFYLMVFLEQSNILIKTVFFGLIIDVALEQFTFHKYFQKKLWGA